MEDRSVNDRAFADALRRRLAVLRRVRVAPESHNGGSVNRQALHPSYRLHMFEAADHNLRHPLVVALHWGTPLTPLACAVHPSHHYCGWRERVRSPRDNLLNKSWR
jgi:hypothetical protein